MLSSIEVITTPTSDTPGTALLFSFNDKRYLIGNIHEGLTRAVVQRGIRLAKVSDIFITGRTEWKSTGGLLGTIMSLADTLSSAAAAVAAAAEEKAVILQKRGKDAKTNVERVGQEKMDSQAVREKLTEEENGEGGVAPADPKLTVHGGPNITHSIAAARKFIFRKRMSVCVDEFLETQKRRGADCDWEPDWVDERLQVWTMAIAPTENGEAGSLPGSQSPLKRRYKEFADDQSPASAKTDRKSSPISAAPSAPSADDQRIRASVISDMFGSPWHMACFHEVPLAEVKMPAQIFTRDQDTQEIRPYRGPVPDEANAVPQINVLVRRPWPGALVMNLPATKPSKVAMSYIMRNHRQRGRFQPQKAIALKVRPGPLFAKLANGESVQSMDGRTITPDMVLLEPREGSGVAVVDLPSHEYVHNLVERPEWQVPKVMSGVEMIIWILGPGVGQNEQLQRFMSQYGHLKHMISSQDHCPNYISFDSSASGALRLNQIDPARYPIPVHDNLSLPQLGQPKISQPKSERHPNIDIIQAKRGMKLMLTPSVSINIDQYAPPLDTVKVLLTTPPAVLKLGQAAREIIESESHQKEVQRQDLPSPDAEIICLGTGSALPSKYRNVSSTLLRVPGSGSYLLDCGENTLGQLKRLYRPEQLSELLRDLKLIWISHLHADHHLGLTSVIKAWYEEIHGQKIGTPQEPRTPRRKQGTDQASWIPVKDSLVLVSSHSMTEFLREYSQVEDFGFDHVTKLYTRGAYDGAPSSVLYYDNCRVGFDFGPEERRTALKTATGLSNLQSCYVNHCRDAQAVSLTFPTGFKFSYSGDCRPSKIFAEIGKGSTVLLHEATFDDEMQKDAKAKKHSTTSEAIGVGVAMGARRIVLTHFSQRYQKIPIMSDVEGLDVKLEEASSISDDREGDDPDTALAVNVDDDPTTSEVTEAHSVSVKQALPPDLKVAVAFDYMRVKVGDIIHVEKFTPALLKLFEEEEPEQQVERQEDGLADKTEQMVQRPQGSNNRKSRPEKKAEKMMGKKTGKNAGKNSPKKAREHSISQGSGDGQAEPTLGEAKEMPQSLPLDPENGSLPKESGDGERPPEQDRATNSAQTDEMDLDPPESKHSTSVKP